jgi:hypothetical protein
VGIQIKEVRTMKVDVSYATYGNHNPQYPTIFKGEVATVYFGKCEVGFLMTHDDGTFSIVLEHPATADLDAEGRLWLKPRFDYSESK